MIEKDLIQISTCGSVDDGKSTLLGRLLYELDGLYKDQIESVKSYRKKKSGDEIDYSLFFDGLKSEREQGITVDVAYRYFQSSKRKFILADCPGHDQYTRNMITGCSNANIGIIVLDAYRGLTPQSRRHALILSLLKVPHIIVAINKMDLVDYKEEKFQTIASEFLGFSEKLNLSDIRVVPISALKGDNVTKASDNMDWYKGETVSSLIDSINVQTDANLVDFRLPIQISEKINGNRYYMGRISSGSIKKDLELLVLPSREEVKVTGIIHSADSVSSAKSGQSVSITLDREVDVARGDMFVRKNNLPIITNKIDSIICWFSDTALDVKKTYIYQCGAIESKVHIESLLYEIDVNSLHRKDVRTLTKNQIGRVLLNTSKNLYFDSFGRNKETGSFILIDPESNETIGAGIVRGEDNTPATVSKKQVFEEDYKVDKEFWESKHGHKASVIWITGLSGSGKSSVAKKVSQKLISEGHHVIVLDGDNLRSALNNDLGFTIEDRKENIRRVSHVANLFYKQGYIVICPFISPFIETRNKVRSLFPDDGFHEVQILCSIDECKKRDVKGLYEKAERGEIKNFTGIDSPYEVSKNPELSLDTENKSLEESATALYNYIKDRIS